MYDDGERKIVLGGMQIPINLWIQYSRDFNAVYTEISKERRDVYFLDEFLDWVAWYVRYNISDRIHPNPAGYDIIVWNLYDFLQDKDIITK
jgi:acyl-CoA thioesterase-1